MYPWNKGLTVKDGTLKNDKYLAGIRRSRKYGKDHPNYKGGSVTVNGYKEVMIKGKRYLEHRLVMEAVLGRKLLKNEEVHHIDGNKLNNDPSNLMVLSPSEHQLKEHSLKERVGECEECGKEFDLPRKKTNKRFCSEKCQCHNYYLRIKMGGN